MNKKNRATINYRDDRDDRGDRGDREDRDDGAFSWR